INGQKGQMGQTNYSAAKAGVIGFTKALAQESARKGITVNAICPGYIDTDMVAAMTPDALKATIAQIPVGRLGKAEEIAALAVFLASDQAGLLTQSSASGWRGTWKLNAMLRRHGEVRGCAAAPRTRHYPDQLSTTPT